MAVAPLAGAWIETVYAPIIIISGYVAPLAGAWIETMAVGVIAVIYRVAPLAGAWIETGDLGGSEPQEESRSPRGSVD